MVPLSRSLHASRFAKLRGSGINVFHPAVAFTKEDDTHEITTAWFGKWNACIAWHPDYFRRIDTPSDLNAARSESKIGIVIGMQDANHLRTVADLDDFYAMGQRLTQITYNSTNRFGSGCIARWKSDAVLRAAARGGGVLGITSVRQFVGGPTVSMQHVGLGSDFDLDPHPACDTPGLNNPERVYARTEGLIRRGFGGNFKRALNQIWMGADLRSGQASGLLSRESGLTPATAPQS